jgi:hypothetical protein
MLHRYAGPWDGLSFLHHMLDNAQPTGYQLCCNPDYVTNHGSYGHLVAAFASILMLLHLSQLFFIWNYNELK